MPELSSTAAENILNSLVETIAENIPKQKSVRFFEEDTSIKSQFNRLFGREKPIHHLLGGGKSADVLLWRNKKISGGVLASATAIWVLFEWLNYHLLSLICFALFIGMCIVFLWSNASALVNRSQAQVPRVVCPEELFVNIAISFGAQLNLFLGFLQDVASGRNLKQFLLVAAGLWAAAIIGSWCNFLTVIYLGFVAERECQKVCRLRKAIYGLKQSPRAWFQKLSENIENEGFRRSSADHSLFVKKTSIGTVIVLIYVDDIIVTGDDIQGISNIKGVLGRHFVTKDLGELRYFLGIEFARNQKGLIMCQRKYVTDVLQETGMLGCRPASTPMDINTRLYDDDTEDVDARQYRGIVGKLLYITVTRPDIAYAVSRVSQFMDKPKKVHWDAAMMILRYLKNSPGMGLFFQNGTSLTISVYVDADYAGCHLDRKSTTGFCVFIGSNLVTWKSKKQTVVATSSAESEYRAMAQATAEVMWVRSLMLDLTVEVPLPMQLLGDNKAALFIANNPAFHERTKHVEVDCHYTRDMIQTGFVSTSHISTTGQTADIFTKALARGPFQSCCSKLSLFDIYAPT
ncbi:retrovirus-related Pol polyprotein from transposon RE1 isoform X2 [Nymphaea colorata]|nr:retrovirus-related Pol polyprotein from transposon RE1 isoform X2 [Nymphaea colorata]XP_049931236.1 retrovirus-related Pol polyprotein from transposon RE1 isoform X2 [Nymphaea colorata]XP_049931237.1 retrovirus-related Pol polyprotein from transposon RE1 isoform X2 [Nymphaea colorata]XP_049931238.1 retrovirus-related Pol polyprotein from transposon RE1 isoform X2 [Nymphaea colorata]